MRKDLPPLDSTKRPPCGARAPIRVAQSAHQLLVAGHEAAPRFHYRAAHAPQVLLVPVQHSCLVLVDGAHLAQAREGQERASGPAHHLAAGRAGSAKRLRRRSVCPGFLSLESRRDTRATPDTCHVIISDPLIASDL
eukprot:scaffold327_cov257-Pinguiococcus_pyrenoidosus.AAC.43